MLDTLFAGEVMHKAIALIDEKNRATVGGRCDSAAAR
jgi:hypothetical protein